MNYLAPMFLSGFASMDPRLALAAPLAWVVAAWQLATPSTAGEWTVVGVPFVSTAIALPFLIRRLDRLRREERPGFRKESARLGILFGFAASMITGFLMGMVATAMVPEPRTMFLRAFGGVAMGLAFGLFGTVTFALSIVVSGSLYGLLIGRLLELATPIRSRSGPDSPEA